MKCKCGHEQDSHLNGKGACGVDPFDDCELFDPIAGAGEGASNKCGKPAGSMIPRLGMSYACVLDKGHSEPCMRGGNCFKHGEYIGNQCPKWPDCIQSAVASSPVEGGSPKKTVTVVFDLHDETHCNALAVLLVTLRDLGFTNAISANKEAKNDRQ